MWMTSDGLHKVEVVASNSDYQTMSVYEWADDGWSWIAQAETPAELAAHGINLGELDEYPSVDMEK